MADVILSTKIKSEYVSLVLEVFNAYAGSTIGYSVMKNNPTPPMVRIDNFNFKYPVKGESETDKAFAEMVIKELVTGFVKCYKLGQDTERNRLEHNAILPPAQNVSEIIS